MDVTCICMVVSIIIQEKWEVENVVKLSGLSLLSGIYLTTTIQTGEHNNENNLKIKQKTCNFEPGTLKLKPVTLTMDNLKPETRNFEL